MTHFPHSRSLLAAFVLLWGAPLGGQSLLRPPPAPPEQPALGVVWGWWRVGKSGENPELVRRTLGGQLSQGSLDLEGFWAREEDVNPGVLGFLVFSSLRKATQWFDIVGGVGGGAIDYRADQRAQIAADCGQTAGCLFEGEGIRSGWATITAVRTSAHLILGQVSVGYWLARGYRVLGEAGPDSRSGPSGHGWEVRVRF